MSLELDSVFQLKKLCKEFYSRKNAISGNLISTLDALSNERPAVLSTKRRHFKIDDANTRKDTTLDWMRLGAERDRISKFKHVVKDAAAMYYSIVTEYAKLLGDEKARSSMQVDNLLSAGLEVQPADIIKRAMKDKQLMSILKFITDFMKQVIENGSNFSKNHLFLMLLHLTDEEVANEGKSYLNSLFQELNVERSEFKKFLTGLTDPSLKRAYSLIDQALF